MRSIAKYIIIFILVCVCSGVVKNEILLYEISHLFSQKEINNFRITNYLSLGVETVMSIGILLLVFATTYYLLSIFTINYMHSRDALEKYAKAIKVFFYCVIFGEMSKIAACLFADIEFVSFFTKDPDYHSHESAIFAHTQYMISVGFIIIGLGLFSYYIAKLFKVIPKIGLILPLLFIWMYFGIVHFIGIKEWLM